MKSLDVNCNFAVVGLNHNSSPIGLQERVSFNAATTKVFLRQLKIEVPLGQFVVLSTCNRVEIYVGMSNGGFDLSKIANVLTSFHGISKEELMPFLYIYTDAHAIKHLFEVSVGLNSLVVGEAQILGQVKESYKISLNNGFTSKSFNIIFQKAFSISKKVRTLTKIGEGNISISSIACQLAERVLDTLEKRKVLLIGMGKTGILTLRILKQKGARNILISNRTYKKAQEFAVEFNGTAIKMSEVSMCLQDVDLVVSSTISKHYLIDLCMIKNIMKKRKQKKLVLIDLAVPRDIDPEVSRIKNVYLYNIDSLKNIANKSLEGRAKEIVKCTKILDEYTDSFLSKHMKIH